MERFDRQSMALAFSLSCLAGYVDTLGFLQLGGYFVSFMSGNSTRLSIAYIDGDWPHVTLIGCIIALFVSGSLCGTLIRHFCPDPRKTLGVLLLVTLLLICAAFSHTLGKPLLAIGFMTLSMGSVNAVFQRQGDIAVGLTYMTGTLVKIGQRLANALLGGAPFAWVPYLLLWISLITGGVLGAMLHHRLGLGSLWLAALWALAISLALIRKKSETV